jgi:hypothetical protein
LQYAYKDWLKVFLKVAVKVQKGIKKTGVVFFMWKRIPEISGVATEGD